MLTEATKTQYKYITKYGEKNTNRVPSGRPQEYGDMPKMRNPEPIC